MKTLRDYINLLNEAPINIDVRGIQQAAKVKAYQDAKAAGKSEEEAQNAEAAAGNLAGANALSGVDINNPATHINNPGDQRGPSSEAERQAWIKDPTVPNQAVQPQPAQPKQPAAPATLNPGVLGMGSKGPAVTELQKRLGINPDGDFGPETRDAVIALQKKLGVTADGMYGPATKAAFDKVATATPVAEPATTGEPLDPQPASLPPIQGNDAPQGQPPSTSSNTVIGTADGATQAIPTNVNPEAPVQGQTGGGAVSSMGNIAMQRRAARANAQAQAQGMQEMSSSDAKLLDRMLTIAKLR